MSFDLGEARRLRGVAPRDLVISGEDGEVEAKYTLVGELPTTFFDAGSRASFSEAIRALFLVPEEAEDFVERFKPSIDDIADLVTALYPGVGESLGEALRSGMRSTASGTT